MTQDVIACIGIAAPLSGRPRDLGREMAQAAELAIVEANETGGVRAERAIAGSRASCSMTADPTLTASPWRGG